MGMPNTALSAKFVNEDRFLEGQMESWKRHNVSTMLLPFQPLLGRGLFHTKCRQKVGDTHPSV